MTLYVEKKMSENLFYIVYIVFLNHRKKFIFSLTFYILHDAETTVKIKSFPALLKTNI